MVVKIQPPSGSISRVIDYNDRKVDSGLCEVVGLLNTGTTSVGRSYDVLEAYARGSIRTRDVVFHASVNPSVTDGMDRRTALLFIKDLMRRLGYGEQPAVIFEHNDTGRRHWHIVSVRVDRDGKKIDPTYEGRRCLDIVRSLQSTYHYTVGRGDGVARNPAEYDLTLDLTQRIEKALRYRVTTPAQLRAVLQTLGVRVNDLPSGGVTFQMLDADGKPKSAPVDAEDLMIPCREDVDKMILRNRYSNEDTFRRRSRVNGCVRAALTGCTSEAEFRRRLAPKGIDAVFSRTDEGHVFGVTFIDHTSRSVFKGSELEKGLSASAFEALLSGPWNPDADSRAVGAAAPSASRRTGTSEGLPLGREIASAAVQAVAESGTRQERDIPRKKRRKRRI